MTKNATNHDVIVVGAGPAGATAARHCALGGLDTLLLEKDTLPRFKPCAGGVTMGALRALDFELPESVIERRCRGVRVGYKNIVQDVQVPETIAVMVTRSRFDEFLALRAVEAGAELRQGEVCTGIRVTDEGITVQTADASYTASLVIGADGLFSRVRRSLGRKFESDEKRLCVIADIPMEPDEIERRFADRVVLNYSYITMGYAWIFPKASHISTGIGSGVSKDRELPELLRAFLSSQDIVSQVPIRGCFLPFSRWRHSIYANRIMLVGDAAGLVDAFSGEGIRHAIASGKLAAQVAERAKDAGDYSEKTLGEYQDRCWEQIGDELFRSNKATELVFRHPNLLLRTALNSREALERYIRTVHGDLSFTDYVSWLKRRLPRYLIRRFLLLQRPRNTS
jgi:geranylgeranyl reductase family protein